MQTALRSLNKYLARIQIHAYPVFTQIYSILGMLIAKPFSTNYERHLIMRLLFILNHNLIHVGITWQKDSLRRI